MDKLALLNELYKQASAKSEFARSLVPGASRRSVNVPRGYLHMDPGRNVGLALSGESIPMRRERVLADMDNLWNIRARNYTGPETMIDRQMKLKRAPAPIG